MSEGPELLILAHGERWDGRFQITSLAASVAATGGRVEIALFFGALAAWVEERWDALDPAPPLTATRIDASAFPPLSSLLEPGRQAGTIRLFGCSASARLLGLDLAAVQAKVDALLGWQTFAQKIATAHRVVTL